MVLKIKKSKYELGLPHWNKKQRQRFQQILEAQERGECKVAYWNSDAHGFPANYNCKDLYWRAEPGKIQEIDGPLKLCTSRALHATMEPHKWLGSKVWIVALWGEIKTNSDKLGALKREIIGEILPHEAFNESIGVRLGRKDLAGANLAGANLFLTNLIEVNLYKSNLTEADLSEANLFGANLFGANLTEANLYRANLSKCNLTKSNLYKATLSETDLYEVNLSEANLSRADFCKANLSHANLYKANLTGANLIGINLYGAKLYEANLYGAYVGLDIKINGWKNVNGYLEK